MELKLIFTIFRRWAWLMIIGAVIGAGAAYIYSIYQMPVYQATTKFMVLQTPDSALSDVQVVGDKELAETYIELLVTQPVLDATSEAVGSTVRATQVSASRVPSTRLIEVTVRSNDPQQAALIANTLVEVLTRQNEALQASRYSSTEESLQLQVQEIEQEIATLQDQLTHAVRKKAWLIRQQQIEQQKVELEQRIFQLQAEIAPIQQEIDDLTPDASAQPAARAADDRTAQSAESEADGIGAEAVCSGPGHRDLFPLDLAGESHRPVVEHDTGRPGNQRISSRPIWPCTNRSIPRC